MHSTREEHVNTESPEKGVPKPTHEHVLDSQSMEVEDPGDATELTATDSIPECVSSL